MVAAGAGVGSACAGKAKNDVAVGRPGAPVEHIEMDPIKIAAVKGPDGVHLETFDAAELFEQAGKALSEKRYDDAIARLRPAAEGVPATPLHARPRSTTRPGLPGQEGLADGGRPVQAAGRRATPDTSDAKDALFQLGATYAEMGNWPASADDLRAACSSART